MYKDTLGEVVSKKSSKDSISGRQEWTTILDAVEELSGYWQVVDPCNTETFGVINMSSLTNVIRAKMNPRKRWEFR